MMTRRRWILFGLLVLTIGASVWVPDSDKNMSDVIAAPVVRQVRQPAAMATPEEHSATAANVHTNLELGQLERQVMPVSDQNPFGVKSWFVPPPPPPVSLLPPPQPTAPPLPFIYAGKFEEEGGRWVVYLVKGDQSYAVTKGDTFDGVYRFDGIKNGNLVIQYLPLSIKQLLPIGTDS